VHFRPILPSDWHLRSGGIEGYKRDMQYRHWGDFSRTFPHLQPALFLYRVNPVNHSNVREIAASIPEIILGMLVLIGICVFWINWFSDR
jgi:hypothetical protein